LAFERSSETLRKLRAAQFLEDLRSKRKAETDAFYELEPIGIPLDR